MQTIKNKFVIMLYWIFWLFVILIDLSDSGPDYTSMASTFGAIGTTVLLAPILFMIAGGGSWQLVLVGFAAYLTIGLALHFILKSSYGSYFPRQNLKQ
jgi:hypothetical protein